MSDRFVWEFDDIEILSYPPEIIHDLHRRDADVVVIPPAEEEVEESE